MMRKLEKQAMAQAAKEAKKQQGKQLLSSQNLTLHHNVVFKPNLFVSSSNDGCRGEEEEEGADEDS